FKTNKKDYMTWEEIKALHDEGFEVGNHTADHLGISSKNFNELESQLRRIDERCREHGIPAPVSFAWPGNSIAVEALPILRTHGIRFARRGGAPEFPYKEGKGVAYEPGLDDPLLIPSAGDGRPFWKLDDFVAAVQKTGQGKIAVLQFHGVPEGEHPWVHTPLERFEEYMHYLHEQGYQVIALRDLAKYVDSTQFPKDPFAIIDSRKTKIEAESKRNSDK
ncbi:MAG: polysaccharide deacetylase family protein, partial [Planctomycetes bacterium]|nr:polysaccharide deacetylase family protein [Planctomycetota bacterium]